MKNRPLIFWVSITIFLVGSLPFLLSWYQINGSNEAIIDQSQKSHMIIARATADRIGSSMDKYLGLAESLGDNSNVYLKPDSKESADFLKSVLLSQNEIVSIAVMLRSNNQELELIQLLKHKSTDAQLITQTIKNNQDGAIKLINFNQKNAILFNKPTARPNVSISIITNIDFEQYLDPSILGQSANLYLLNETGTIIASSGGNETDISDSIINQIKSNNVISSANRIDDNNNKKSIEALANVPFSPWYIVSQQPTKFAEITTTKMARTAIKAFILAVLLMIALVVLAYYSWIKPLRKIILNQRKLMGLNDSEIEWEGDEVLALEKSFESLTQHINDRNTLGNIFVDRYQVISPIGKGGMSSVFLGWDPRLNRHVALKTLPLDANNSFGTREYMSQFLVQEAITAAKISHRNIVSIYDVVSTENTAFIAMEFIDGENLGSVLSRIGPMNLSTLLPIIVAVCRGLESAHSSGFIHRDIKPENILLGQNGEIKLTDFGTTILLRSSEQDFATGTSGYIAPEIYQKGSFSVQSDLFSLGVTIATCLLGNNPFYSKKQHITKSNSIHKKIIFSNEITSQGHEDVFELIESLFNKDPDKRPKSASLFADMIIEKAQQKIQWDTTSLGIQSAQENIYENSENTTLHFNND